VARPNAEEDAGFMLVGSLLLVRRSRRVKAELPVRWVRARDAIAMVADSLSIEGLFLRIAEPPPVGSLVPIEVDLPSGQTVQMVVVVRFIGKSSRGAGMGVEIHSLDKEWHETWRLTYESLSVRRHHAQP
jgi:hypothetical protein